MDKNVAIRRLASGVPGLDEVLGGGFLEFSLNLIVGGPGTGKTTLGQQIMFANASAERTAIFFTVVGEPPIKMLRHMQQRTFFDPEKVEESIRFIHLGEEAKEGLAKVFERIVAEVEASNPAIVVVDSFRSVMGRTVASPPGMTEEQDFMQRLATHLTSCKTTTFLLGEYDLDDHNSAVFTVADSIAWLTQAVERNSVVRKLLVQKMRGQAQIPGLQTMRLTDEGVHVYPRLAGPWANSTKIDPPDERLATGVPALDDMLGGGLPRAYSAMISGPSGSGKTLLCNHFILEGIRQGKPAVLAVFGKRPNEYLETTPHGAVFTKLVEEKKLEIVYLRPLDLSIDEAVMAIRDAVVRSGADRVVLDSLCGLELALAPTFREDFRESLYRLVSTLRETRVTVMAASQLSESHSLDFLWDAIVVQRFVEVSGQIRRLISVSKVRGSQHSKELREYEIVSDGTVRIAEMMFAPESLLSGAPQQT